MDKFKMALDFLGWEEKDLNDCLVEFAQFNMIDIFKKIRNNDVKSLTTNDLTTLCDEFMFAFPAMIEQFKNNEEN